MSGTHARGDDAVATVDVLQLIADGVTAVAGFAVAAISAVRDDRFEVLAVAGPDDATRTMAGVALPVDSLLAEIQGAQEWGPLRFLPHEQKTDRIDDFAWTPDYAPLDGADAWHPDDLLVALLRDDEGELRGLLSMDLPLDGRRPSAAQQGVLRHYADQAGRAVVAVLAQEEAAERVRLARTARLLVREATAQPSQVSLLDTVRHLLVEGFGCTRVAIYTFGDSEGQGSSSPDEVSQDLTRAAERWARQSWGHQEAMRVPEDVVGPHPLRAGYVDFLERAGLASLLVVPLGAAHEVVGCLSLGRSPAAPAWTAAEMDTALDIGHDLGRAVLNARTLDRERRLAHDKDELVTALAHEMMTPITSIVGHVELMLDDAVDTGVRRGLDAVARGTTRLQVMARDLIRLAATDAHGTPFSPQPVELDGVVAEVLELHTAQATRAGVGLHVELRPGEPAVVSGERPELLRVLSNLVGNAVKYTDPGGRVTVRLTTVPGGVLVEVADTGLGIAPADRDQLFTAFFRSSNPAAAARPGTGLGLTIVRRTVARHGGTVEVDSTLDVGSTFRVFLPS